MINNTIGLKVLMNNWIPYVSSGRQGERKMHPGKFENFVQSSSNKFINFELIAETMIRVNPLHEAKPIHLKQILETVI